MVPYLVLVPSSRVHLVAFYCTYEYHGTRSIRAEEKTKLVRRHYTKLLRRHSPSFQEPESSNSNRRGKLARSLQKQVIIMTVEIIDLISDDENDSNVNESTLMSQDAALKESSSETRPVVAETSPEQKPVVTPKSASPKHKIDSLKYRCWNPRCEVPLCNPKHRNLELSCYALHSHPLLRIPICSVCSDDIAQIELSRLDTQNVQEDVCNTCGNESDVLFLCDGDKCSRTMCGECIKQASNSAEILEELEASNEDWHCCHCQPTKIIQVLQSHVEQLAEEASTCAVNLDELINELQMVEEKKAECENVLGEEETYRNEIKSELSHAESNEDPSQFEATVQNEIDLWKEVQERHYNRLLDMISLLQEDLERRGDFNLKELYTKPADESMEKEPQWKMDADKAIYKREQIERKTAPRPRPLPCDQKEDDMDDIEELGSLSDSSQSETEERAQWRQSAFRATKWEIEQALKTENEVLVARQAPMPLKIEESEDRKSTKAEDRVSAKVRRDSLVVLHESKQRAQRLRNRASVRSSGQPQKKARSLNPVSVSSAFSSVARTRPKPKEVTFDSPTFLPAASRNLFQNSPLFLTDQNDDHQYHISVAEPLAKVLKPHQREGIQFMFQNSFGDLAFREEQDRIKAKEKVGGCVLAHNMGLGKSLSCVALLHTLFFHPDLRKQDGQQVIHTAILVVPVNTIANWENEFIKWTHQLSSSIRVYNLSNSTKRRATILKWAAYGGVLLTSDALFRTVVKKMSDLEIFLRGPDVIVLDEAHTMLKNKSNEVFKALNGVRTRRRVCLTGSPFQNNLFEFFRMASYIRPGVLGSSERQFEKNFINPIVSGLSSDAKSDAKQEADEKLNKIQELLRPFVQRKDASVLLEDLPPMQQVVLHVRQTKIQSRLYGAYKKYQQSSEENNFLRMYSSLRVVHNHPGCLLLNKEDEKAGKDGRRSKSPPNGRRSKSPPNMNPRSEKITPVLPQSSCPIGAESKLVKSEPNVKVETEDILGVVKEEMKMKKPEPKMALPDLGVVDLISDSEEDEAVSIQEGNAEVWWSKVAERSGIDTFSDVESGNKVALLLHILTHAQILGEKVVLFSQCLKVCISHEFQCSEPLVSLSLTTSFLHQTLDFISSVLSQEDWPSLVSSLADAFPGKSIGGWKSGSDFLRIDGATSAGNRGELISQFNEDSVRLFLISSRAGGIGINLCSANRVILFDSNFNPTIDMQALYRCYRYGQSKSVFAYRFLTEGTMEEKVYSRAVNKSSLALSLVDGKNFHRCFTAEETADFSKNDEWVACERCNKWRMFPPGSVDISTLPDQWYCEMMDKHDSSLKIDCTFPEQDTLWYHRHHAEMKKAENDAPIIAMTGGSTSMSDDTKEKLVQRDKILTKLLDVSTGHNKSNIISRYYFHDALLKEKESQDAPTLRTENKSLNEEQSEAMNEDSIDPTIREKMAHTPLRGDKSTLTSAFAKPNEDSTSSSLPQKRHNSAFSKPTIRRRLNFASLWAGDDERI